MFARRFFTAAAVCVLFTACTGGGTLESTQVTSDTSAPLTQTPQTASATTVVTTDLPPVTEPPTTVAASTVVAPTVAPSTIAPTTLAPTTAVPTTLAATTLPASTVAAPPPQAGSAGAMAQPLAAIGSSSGREAARMQQRLLDLGFWLVAVDGDYGHTTKQAVMAFQKYHKLSATGSLDNATARLLSSSVGRPQARSTGGNVIEVDKDRQILMVVRSGQTKWVLNTSTASGQYYYEENAKKPGVFESGRSVTPSGKYRIYRQRPDGWWEGDLGKIYRPKYFRGGIAIHGSGSIPNYPASHGCVRLSTPAMDMVWDSEIAPMETLVWVYGDDVPARNEAGPPSGATTTTTVAATTTTKAPVTTPSTTRPPATTSPTTKPPVTTPPTTVATTTTTAAPTTTKPPASTTTTTTPPTTLVPG